MAISNADYLAMLARTQPVVGRVVLGTPCQEAVVREIPLHNEIIQYCNAQHPRWKYIHANPAAKSSIQVGAPDFPIIYLPGGRFVIVECKTKTGKLDPDQLAFKLELEMLGHKVNVVRSFSEFLEAARAAKE